MNQIHIFLILAHQATKTQAHGLFLERETHLVFDITCCYLKRLRKKKMFFRTFCMNKIHIFLILAHQATKNISTWVVFVKENTAVFVKLQRLQTSINTST